MNVLILGYYHRGNLGDDMFMEAFHSLFPYRLTFGNPDDLKTIPENTDAVIVGSGDLFNKYFIPNVSKLLNGFQRPVFAVGVGVSYVSTIYQGYFDAFDQVWIRNPTDLRTLQKRIGVKAHTIPDFGFSLNIPVPRIKQPHIFTLGVFLADALHQEIDIPGLADSIRTISQVAAEEYSTVRILLFAFNLSLAENDTVLNQKLGKALSDCNVTSISCRNVSDTLHEMSDLDFAIVMRYHAHVFCMLLNIPFVSIAQTPKAICLLKEAELPEPVKDVSRVADALLQLDVADMQNRMKSYVKMARSLVHASVQRIQIQLQASKRIAPFTPTLSWENKIQQVIDFLQSELQTETADIPRIARQIIGILTDKRVVTFSPFLYGLERDLKNHPAKIKEMAQYILSEYPKTQDDYIGRFNVDLSNTDCFQGLHRSGWAFATDFLKSLHHEKGVLLDVYGDATFHWNEQELLRAGVLPRREPFVVFIHHTALESYSEYNCVELFKKKSFLQSLHCCVGIYVLSDALAKWMRQELDRWGFKKVIVESLVHPTEFPEQTFNMQRFKDNPKPKLTQTGAWLRNSYAIYQLPGVPHWLQKSVLQGAKMENYFRPSKVIYRKKECKTPHPRKEQKHSTKPHHHSVDPRRRNKWVEGLEKHLRSRPYLSKDIYVGDENDEKCPDCELDPDTLNTINFVVEGNHQSVHHIPQLSNSEYDQLLSANIVFLNLEDASAVNTIQECIVRHTPIVVNRLPATIEALGANYPLLYSSLEEVGDLLTRENIAKAHQYLVDLPKHRLRVENFIQEIRNSKIYAACR